MAYRLNLSRIVFFEDIVGEGQAPEVETNIDKVKTENNK
jgi:hypothetical protein